MWHQYLLLVPLPFIYKFFKTGRLLPAHTMRSLFSVFDATIKDHWDVSAQWRSTEILLQWNLQPHNFSHHKPGRNCRARGVSVSAYLQVPVSELWHPRNTIQDIMCTPQAGTAIFRTHVASLRCLFVRGTAHTSLILAIHSFLLEVKCCIIYTTSLVACILFESWCCADVLREIGETEKQQLCSHYYLFSQESNKSEETSNWMEHCERRDDTTRDCITSQRSHIRTFQWLSNFFISSVNSCWARATSFHLAASHFFLEVRGQILPVPHCSTMRSNCSKPLWHYAALCWASQTLLLSPGTNDVSVFHWLPFY